MKWLRKRVIDYLWGWKAVGRMALKMSVGTEIDDGLDWFLFESLP